MSVMTTTRRAEEIREQTGCSWEYACLLAERERDDAEAQVVDVRADERAHPQRTKEYE